MSNVSTWGQWFKYYFLNIDAIVFICVLATAIYFAYTYKSKKAKFMGLDGKLVTRSTRKNKKLKNKKLKNKPRTQKLNKHEEECRRIFEDIYKTKFPSVRPKWLKNPVTNKNLEIDGFCESFVTHKGIGLGFEYDGAQHSKYNPHFHNNNPDEFVYQVKKDDWKNMKCKELGIVLIRIPHFVAFHDLRRYIISELKRQGIPLSPIGSKNMYS